MCRIGRTPNFLTDTLEDSRIQSFSLYLHSVILGKIQIGLLIWKLPQIYHNYTILFFHLQGFPSFSFPSFFQLIDFTLLFKKILWNCFLSINLSSYRLQGSVLFLNSILLNLVNIKYSEKPERTRFPNRISHIYHFSSKFYFMARTSNWFYII